MQTPKEHAEGAAHQGRASWAQAWPLHAASIPPVAWTPWHVVDRARGFHVSRETGTGAASRVEFLRNEVHQVKVFRKHETAAAACALANGGAAC